MHNLSWACSHYQVKMCTILLVSAGFRSGPKNLRFFAPKSCVVFLWFQLWIPKVAFFTPPPNKNKTIEINYTHFCFVCQFSFHVALGGLFHRSFARHRIFILKKNTGKLDVPKWKCFHVRGTDQRSTTGLGSKSSIDAPPSPTLRRMFAVSFSNLVLSFFFTRLTIWNERSHPAVEEHQLENNQDVAHIFWFFNQQQSINLIKWFHFPLWIELFVSSVSRPVVFINYNHSGKTGKICVSRNEWRSTSKTKFS